MDERRRNETRRPKPDVVEELKSYLAAGGEDYELAVELTDLIPWYDDLAEPLNRFIYRGGRENARASLEALHA